MKRKSRNRFTTPDSIARVSLCLFAVFTSSITRGDDVQAIADFIDQEIGTVLDAARVERVPISDDAEFLRRISLDLHGVVPSVDRVRQFLESTDPDKRKRLIDELVASPRFGDHLADVWRRTLLFRLGSEQISEQERFADWLSERFNADQGWDEIVHQLLTATGTMAENPGVTYLIDGRHPLGVTDLTDITSRYFLGIRLNCAQCHDHPFADWSQKDYWGMAAFFSQIQTPARPKAVHSEGVQDDPRMTLASLADADAIDGFVIHPPTFLGQVSLQNPDSLVLRHELANWMTSADNPYFARAAVNRAWWHLFGRGLVEPVDDMHAGHPASHPELLDALSRRFAESGFNLELLYSGITRSRTYQQTSQPGGDADREAELFARMSIKVLSAAQLFDSLNEVLGPPNGSRGSANQGPARYEFAQFFAEESGSLPTQYQWGIPHTLRLMNSPQFMERNLAALITRLASPDRMREEVVEELYLTILNRYPTALEQEIVRGYFERGESPSETIFRDVAWALLTSSEFMLNH